MGACLQSVAIAARTIAALWGMGDDRLVGVNHCVGRELWDISLELRIDY
jgi:tRNA A37 threonylcarbamoyltransferase TsaD